MEGHHGKRRKMGVHGREICKHLDCSRDTAKKMIYTQTLSAYKIDRKWKFKISEVDSCMRNNN